MTAECTMYIVGTKDSPTMFIMQSGELSDGFEDAQLFMLPETAEEEIRECDEPEQFQVFEVMVSINGV